MYSRWTKNKDRNALESPLIRVISSPNQKAFPNQIMFLVMEMFQKQTFHRKRELKYQTLMNQYEVCVLYRS